MTMLGAMHLHPIVDHFTIALLTVAVLCDAGAAVAAIMRGPIAILQRLRHCAFILILLGAAASVCTCFSGEADANRLWDSMPPAAQTLLFSATGAARMLAHATLGRYLMYSFIALAAWRIALELAPITRRSAPAYLLVAIAAAGALLYQGRTGGQLVYDYGVGTRTKAAQTPSPVTHRPTGFDRHLT
jgi:uncharacterized membrane protein